MIMNDYLHCLFSGCLYGNSIFFEQSAGYSITFVTLAIGATEAAAAARGAVLLQYGFVQVKSLGYSQSNPCALLKLCSYITAFSINHLSGI